MYTMGRAGTLPWFRTYPSQPPDTCVRDRLCAAMHRGNPARGLVVATDYIFGFLETIATLAVIVLYAMANLALTHYMRRKQRTNFTVGQHVAVPWIATLALLPVFFVTVYPEPSWPYNTTPYLFVAALLVGFAYMQWRESCNPGVLRRGAMMLIRSGGTAEGELERSEPIDPL